MNTKKEEYIERIKDRLKDKEGYTLERIDGDSIFLKCDSSTFITFEEYGISINSF